MAEEGKLELTPLRLLSNPLLPRRPPRVSSCLYPSHPRLISHNRSRPLVSDFNVHLYVVRRFGTQPLRRPLPTLAPLLPPKLGHLRSCLDTDSDPTIAQGMYPVPWRPSYLNEGQDLPPETSSGTPVGSPTTSFDLRQTASPPAPVPTSRPLASSLMVPTTAYGQLLSSSPQRSSLVDGSCMLEVVEASGVNTTPPSSSSRSNSISSSPRCLTFPAPTRWNTVYNATDRWGPCRPSSDRTCGQGPSRPGRRSNPSRR